MHYCDHFIAVNSPKVQPNSKFICRQCTAASPFVWICLTKGCGHFSCENNKFKHMYEHQKQNKKTNHCVFLNPMSAEIKCISCKIEIYDFEFLTSEQLRKYKMFSDPLLIRQKYLPKLEQMNIFQMTGQLQNSAAHKKSNKGLCGLFKRRTNSVINCVIQYFSNIPYYKSILKHIKTEQPDKQKFIRNLSDLITHIWTGQMRCLSSNQIIDLVLQQLPKYKGYQRKDPFEVFTLFLNNIHEYLKYYDYARLTNEKFEESIEDEWIIMKNKNNKFRQYSCITNPLSSQIEYHYMCKKCKKIKKLISQIMGVKLDIPRKKKSLKELEAQFQKYKYSSPIKTRGKSMFERILGSSQEIPISIVQLFINFMESIESPLQSEKICQGCKGPLAKVNTKYTKLPKLLFLHINRMNPDGYTINNKMVDFSTQTLDMRGFAVEDYCGQTLYQFTSSINLTKENEFITLARNCKNKQKYEFKDEMIKINFQTYAPYLLCYTQKKSKTNLLYHNVKSNIKLNLRPQIPLPEFWIYELKYFEIPGPLINPMACKHGAFKPKVERKCVDSYLVPRQIVEALIEKFQGRKIKNIQCQRCERELIYLNIRKKRERQYVNTLDKYKCNHYCMISCHWLNRWTQFLYKRTNCNYFIKSTPVPGPITNSVLLENQQKCKLNLKKGEDYKIINLYVWMFFKQIYGGGPQIQYKNKHEVVVDSSDLNQQLIKQINKVCRQLKQCLHEQFYLKQQCSGDNISSPIKSKQKMSLNIN